MSSVRSTKSTIVVFSLNYEHLFVPASTSDEASSADAPSSNDQRTFNNQKILDGLLSRIDRETPPAKIILMNSSSEQSYHDSDGLKIRNFYDFYQCFCAAIEKIGLATGCEFNGCSLADVYGQKKSGENCERALLGDRTYLFDGHIPDLSSFLPWYMRIHDIASRYPACCIVFNEYDHVSTGLAKFLTKHPYFIPANAKVQLHHYFKTPRHEVEITEDLNLIQGIGNIDGCYGLTIQYMASCIAWLQGKELPPHDKPWNKKEMNDVMLYATTHLELSPLRPVMDYLKTRATSSIKSKAGKETIAESPSAATTTQSIPNSSYKLHSNTNGFTWQEKASTPQDTFAAPTALESRPEQRRLGSG